MSDDTRYERGRERLREVHGDRSLATIESMGDLGRLREVHGDRSLATIESMGDLGRLIVEVAYGDVYSRLALTTRERQIASVAALVATGRSSQLPVHLRSSLKAGLSIEELQEVIIQTATIAGFPPAMNAWSTLKTIASDRDGA